MAATAFLPEMVARVARSYIRVFRKLCKLGYPGLDPGKPNVRRAWRGATVSTTRAHSDAI
ncbi:MAG TPA: hypothetical protein VJ862_05200 [Rhodanobacteraceae bacterium]|nr:hypothetical protein [Rhodanobacteraceae bacterium]